MSNSYRRGERFNKKAKKEGYLARSVYKLEEIQRKLRVFRSGQRVVDLGCYPGSWTQYALERVGRGGAVVGVDLSAPEFSGATFVDRSVYEVTSEELLEALGGRADVVMSDMAPKTTGNRLHDHVVQLELAQRALEIATQTLKPGGTFVVKVFDGEDVQDLKMAIVRHFRQTKRVRPEATRRSSREFFFVGLGYDPAKGAS